LRFSVKGEKRFVSVYWLVGRPIVENRCSETPDTLPTVGSVSSCARSSHSTPGYKYLIFDRDSKFGEQACNTVTTIGLEPLRISFRCPWQNGVAERWVGSCPRDLFDHIVPINEHHLKRLLSEYLAYYHSDRTHLGLEKDTPLGRPTVSAKESEIVSSPRVGGLHHRYDRAA
jgi:hypothetical protein